MKKLVLNLIRFYQKTLSPDHGFLVAGYWPSNTGCRFYPSCSEYSIKAIGKYGLTKGLVKTITRVLRCNPWSRGGVNYP